MTPSVFQQNIFNFTRDEEGSLIVEAVAGSGKTTTLLQLLNMIPLDDRVLMLAFNKSIAEEMKKKAPKHVMVATFHSVGYGVWRRYSGGSIKLDGDRKIWNIIDEIITNRAANKMYASFVKQLVSLAKNAGVGSKLLADEADSYADLIAHHDIYLDSAEAEMDEAIQYTQAVLARSREIAEEVIDFDDMLYMPLVEELQFFRNDFVLIDEAQDTNAVQRELLHRMLKPNGRLFAVGDRHQAIYGFRGADSDAMDLIKREFKCAELPLSISYRCAKAVVAEAQTVVSHIQAHEAAADGEVKQIEEYDPQSFDRKDAILCRVTAPLIDMAYWLIKRGVGVRILGRDIAEQIIRLIKQQKADTIDQLAGRLEQWKRREIGLALENGDESKAERINDRAETINHLIEGLGENDRTIDGLLAVIDELFNSKEGVLSLATVHKAKGLEFQRVFILDRATHMPSKWARQDWQQVQENNLIYVAITRAKQTLAYISLDNRQDEVRAKQAAPLLTPTAIAPAAALTASPAAAKPKVEAEGQPEPAKPGTKRYGALGLK